MPKSSVPKIILFRSSPQDCPWNLDILRLGNILISALRFRVTNRGRPFGLPARMDLVTIQKNQYLVAVLVPRRRVLGSGEALPRQPLQDGENQGPPVAVLSTESGRERIARRAVEVRELLRGGIRLE